MNTENLINLKDRSLDKRREISLLGVKASVKKRQENKKLKEELLMLLNAKDSNGITTREKVSAALIKEAEMGNVKAYKLIFDITEGPITQRVNQDAYTPIVIIDDI